MSIATTYFSISGGHFPPVFPIIFMLLTMAAGGCYRGTAAGNSVTMVQSLIDPAKDLYIFGKTFTDTVDFTTLFSSYPVGFGNHQATCPVNIVFENCTFKQPVYGSSANDDGQTVIFFQKNLAFINCDFENEVSFRGCTFAGNVWLVSNMFDERVIMEESSFRGHTAIQENNFFKEARFQNSIFHEPANFMKSVFHENAGFQGCRFNDHAQWNLIKILGYGDFTLTEFDRNFTFNYAECPGTVVFDHSFFHKRADMISTDFNNLSMRSCFFYELTWESPDVTGNFNFEGSHFFIEPDDL